MLGTVSIKVLTCLFFPLFLQTPPPKAVKKATPAKGTPAIKNGAAAKKAESEDDDDDDSGRLVGKT